MCLLRFLLCCGALCIPFAARADDDIDTVAALLEILIEADPESAQTTLAALAEKVQTGGLGPQQTAELKAKLGDTLSRIYAQDDHALAFDAALLAATWREKQAVAVVRKVVESSAETTPRRAQGFSVLLTADVEQSLSLAEKMLADSKSPLALRTSVLAALGRSDSPRVAEIVLAGYSTYEPELQPKAVELLTQRVAWSKSLLATIGEGKINATVLNANQVARLVASGDEDLKKLVAAKWGTVRTDRNPQRERVVAEMAKLLRTRGDAKQGAVVFEKVCGQCHKIYGQGQDVGPDITLNGRASFDQLLSNVFDPSLVIGAAYQARQIVTTEGRVLTGLATEENDERVVLKIQGGKAETIPREEIDEITTSPLSLMPEGLENQLKAAELADLFAFLVLDRPASDPAAKYLPGTPVEKR